MCGIAGYLTTERHTRDFSLAVMHSMTEAIIHRGPDSDGHWIDPESGIGLGMRRLSIVDLSPAGAQPMTSACGRFVLVYNGEIYNHLDLKLRLAQEGANVDWRGHSDTEVLLASIAHWGLKRTLQLANGMFALALWDRKNRSLELAIDRFGEKPLYVGTFGNALLFASELKSLAAHPRWKGEIDADALTLLLRYAYVPAPHSVFRHVEKLEPGKIIRVHGTVGSPNGFKLERDVYWSAFDVVQGAKSSPLNLDRREIQARFEELFRDSVKIRMMSDVPLGAFLSGGYDSTAVVAIMQQQTSTPVRTFTIGFTEHGYNEAPYAKSVAAHLGTNHTELYVTPEQAMEVIPKLPDIYDEPFADSSQIPTFLVAQLARQHVTVALSGDGGDELFGGYNRYFVSKRFAPVWSRIPTLARSAAAGAIRAVGAPTWDALNMLATMGRSKTLVGDRALKLADLLSAPSAIQGYELLVSSWAYPELVVKNGIEPPGAAISARPLPAGLNFIEQMMYLDLVTYLPGDILTKVDRATMGVSLEGRVPFLDPRLVEFAWGLSLDQKIHSGRGKQVIRDLVHRYVPSRLVNRPKTGFGIPIEQWLRGPLRGWADSLILDRNAGLDEHFSMDIIREHWSQHLSGRRNWQARLWPVLMFGAWKQKFSKQ